MGESSQSHATWDLQVRWGVFKQVVNELTLRGRTP